MNKVFLEARLVRRRRFVVQVLHLCPTHPIIMTVLGLIEFRCYDPANVVCFHCAVAVASVFCVMATRVSLPLLPAGLPYAQPSAAVHDVFGASTRRLVEAARKRFGRVLLEARKTEYASLASSPGLVGDVGL